MISKWSDPLTQCHLIWEAINLSQHYLSHQKWPNHDGDQCHPICWSCHWGARWICAYHLPRTTHPPWYIDIHTIVVTIIITVVLTSWETVLNLRNLVSLRFFSCVWASAYVGFRLGLCAFYLWERLSWYWLVLWSSYLNQQNSSPDLLEFSEQ